MGRFANIITPQGVLILSGFYESDIPQLREKASNYGFYLLETKKNGDWACLIFQAE
jgi:ribosomal protein L11 methylase PrmA